MYQYKIGDVVKVDHVREEETKRMREIGMSLFFPFYIDEFVDKTGTVTAVENSTGAYKVRFSVNLDVLFEPDELDKGDVPKAWTHI